MNPDDFKQAWQAQSSKTRVTIDAELLLKEVRRNQQSFLCTIFWRDVREVGVALVMVPVWIYLGVRHALPWTWYLCVPALLWIAGFMLVDRMRHRRQTAGPSDSLRHSVESSLAEIKHQIWLLRNVFWWYLLPIVIAMQAFLVQVTWPLWSRDLRTIPWVVIVLEVLVFAGIYWLNQYAVRKSLEPRRQELEALLTSLTDESPA